MRAPGSALVPLLAVSLAAAGGNASAGECIGQCADDAVCALAEATCLMDRGENDGAVRALKPALAAHAEDGRLALALALAYLGGGNRVWALKTLLARLETAPGDLETRTWAAWLLLEGGDLDLAEQLLDAAPDLPPGPLAERVALLRASLHGLRGDQSEAEAALADVEERDADLLPEDVELYRAVRARLRGERGAPISLRALLSGGYTTNAVQSAPQEAGAGLAESGAPIAALDVVLRFEPWTSTHLRPVGEVRTKGFAPFTEGTRGLSYLDLGGRAGGEVGHSGGTRLRLLYSYEILGMVDQGWFMDAHRGEVEADLKSVLQIFAGAGRRTFGHLPRTRTEMDIGLAVMPPLAGGWNLTGVFVARLQLARHQAFDDRGLTGLVRVRVPLPADFMIRAQLMALHDAYPSSAAYYNQARRRRDEMLKAEIGPVSPSLRGFRIGLTYTAARRWSTVDGPVDNFNYADHRFLLELRFEGSFDPALPGEADAGEGHLALPYGLEAEGDTGLDRVQDLLRQEDSARRGSSCVD